MDCGVLLTGQGRLRPEGGDSREATHRLGHGHVGLAGGQPLCLRRADRRPLVEWSRLLPRRLRRACLRKLLPWPGLLPRLSRRPVRRIPAVWPAALDAAAGASARAEGGELVAG